MTTIVAESETSQLESSENSQRFAKSHRAQQHASIVNLYLLGLMVVLGDFSFGWNIGLDKGFWENFGGLLITSSGYLCLVFCLGEIMSAIPFSGGIYGLVRAFINPFWGFVIASFQILLYLSYLSGVVQFLGNIPMILGVSSKEYVPVHWVFLYSFLIMVHSLPPSSLWYFATIFGMITLVLLIIYVLGSFENVNFHRWVESNEDHHEFNAIHLLSTISLSSRFYLGIQFSPLAGTFAKEPQRAIPRILLMLFMTIFVLAIAVLFVACSQYPGPTYLSSAQVPLTFGFAKIFNLSFLQAFWVNLPFAISLAYAYSGAGAKEIASMATSGLVPSFLANRFYNLLSLMVISYGLNCLCYYYSNLDTLIEIACLCSYLIFLSILVSYCYFKYKYSSIPREFHSPFSIYGGIIGIIIFLVAIIGQIGYHGNDQTSLVAVGVVFIVSIILYLSYVNTHQKFSEEEKEKLFKAYLINANLESRDKLKKKKKAQFASNHHHSPQLHLKNNKVHDEHSAGLSITSGGGGAGSQSNQAPSAPSISLPVENPSSHLTSSKSLTPATPIVRKVEMTSLEVAEEV